MSTTGRDVVTIVFGLVVCLAARSGQAQTPVYFYWLPESGSAFIDDSVNWQGDGSSAFGATPNDALVVKRAGVVTIDANHTLPILFTTLVPSQIWIGDGAPADPGASPPVPAPGAGHAVQSGGTLNFADAFYVGKNNAPGVSTYDMTGGSIVQTEGPVAPAKFYNMVVGDANSVATMALSSDARIELLGAMSIGNGGTPDTTSGTVTMSGTSSIVTAHSFRIGVNDSEDATGGGTGYVTMSESSTVTADHLVVGHNPLASSNTFGVGNLTMSGDAGIHTTTSLFIGAGANAVGNITMSGTTSIVNDVYDAEFGAWGGTATITMNGNAEISSYWTNIGYDLGNGTVTLNDDAKMTSGDGITIGYYRATGELNLNNRASVMVLTAGAYIGVDSGGEAGHSGTVNMTGDSVFTIANGDAFIGTSTSDITGTVNLSGNSRMNVPSHSTYVGGWGGIGFLNVSGTAQANIDDLQIGTNWSTIEAISQGTVTVDGVGAQINVAGVGTHTDDGTAHVFQNTITIGAAGGIGTLNQNAGVTTSTNAVIVGEYDYYVWETERTAAQGTLNLNGGVFQAPSITTRSNAAEYPTATAAGVINFNGGALKASADSADFIAVDARGGSTMTLNVMAGGAVIDTNGFDIGINRPLVDGGGGGGLTKKSLGTLTLTGDNTYSGDTIVQAGTLSIDAAMLNDDADLSIALGAVMDLNFTGTDTIANLLLDGATQVLGTWGGAASGADHISSYFSSTGQGMVLVTGTPMLIPGDTDNDQDVDADDAAVLATNWGGSVTAGDYTSGDFNGDGFVNAADASILAANWGNHAGEGNGAVPEPGVLTLLAGLGLALAARRARR